MQHFYWFELYLSYVYYFRDTSDEMDCSILELGVGYNKLIAPVDRTSGLGRVEVRMDFDVENMIDINEVLGTFSVKFTLWKTFLNSRLTYRNIKEDDNKNQLSNEERGSLWMPNELFSNIPKHSSFEEFTDRIVHKVLKNPSKPPRKSDMTSSQTIDLYEGVDHKPVFRKEFYVNFLCNYDMSRYPFDTQVCTMEF